jgi:flavin reductase (DIM6/NTAB) family NADH-FMN oxidoreductase RutF
LENSLPDLKDGISTATYLAGLRSLVQPVALVTVARDGRRDGQTAVTICSATMDPPTLLVCIRQDVAMTDMILDAQAFGVSFLADTQAGVARQFSSDGDGRIDSADDRWQSDVTGAPLLKSAVSAFDCELAQVMPYGSHSLFLGRVVSMKTTEGEGLLYGDGYFRRLAAKD